MLSFYVLMFFCYNVCIIDCKSTQCTAQGAAVFFAITIERIGSEMSDTGS